MMENSVYSVISPEGCAEILWKDSSKAPYAADCLKLTAQDLLEYGIINKIIKEKGINFEHFFARVCAVCNCAVG